MKHRVTVTYDVTFEVDKPEDWDPRLDPVECQETLKRAWSDVHCKDGYISEVELIEPPEPLTNPLKPE